ncbi:FliH/SctL family protein [Pseudoneobacillus sp. C159]
MTYYSKVFKASHLSVVKDVKVISQTQVPSQIQNIGTDQPIQPVIDLAKEKEVAHQIIQEAQLKAREIIKEAEQRASLIIDDTEEKASMWWKENEQRLENLSQEAKDKGFQEGLNIGKKEAEEKINQEYKQKIEEVQALLEHAYKQKETIILEAEPFLLELSYAISSQIIKQELESYPDKFMELIKQHILRFKEKEFITVCVHPEDFDFIQSQRALLLAVVNGETEIKIIPDHSVSPKGCIIRTAYGSIDARIDTQIEEIKKVIQEARRVPEGEVFS